MIREELILQYLNNELTPEQAKTVIAWAEQNPADFQLTRDIWELSSQSKDIKTFDLDEEWGSFLASMDESEISQETEEASYSSDNTPEAITTEIFKEAPVVEISRWKEWRPALVAASMLFIVMVAYFLWPRTYEISHFANVDQDEVILPDDTKVTIDKNSTIAYPSSFDGQSKRIVKLDGIAVFDITPNPDQPFIVETSNSGVKALGTIFEVDATEPGLTGVENIEGLIRFFDIVEESKFKDVKEGESFVYDGSDFVETTPIDPIIRRFEAPPLPKVTSYTVREIINYLYRISNGSATTVGDNFDYNKRITIELNTTNVEELIDKLDRTPNVVIDARKKDCRNCFEIRSLLKR